MSKPVNTSQTLPTYIQPTTTKWYIPLQTVEITRYLTDKWLIPRNPFMLSLLQTGREHNMADLLMSYPDFLARIFFLCWYFHDGKLYTASRVLEFQVENGEFSVIHTIKL